MQDLPHVYRVSAEAKPDGDVPLNSVRLSPLHTATPLEFGGPGNLWSPETLLTGAVIDCFVLTFRGVSRAMKLPWTALHCEIFGKLERVQNVTQFTGFDLVANLELPDDADPELARRALEKADRTCLISNSLKGPVHLRVNITQEAAVQPVFG